MVNDNNEDFFYLLVNVRWIKEDHRELNHDGIRNGKIIQEECLLHELVNRRYFRHKYNSQ
jgi:hypothetical protein